MAGHMRQLAAGVAVSSVCAFGQIDAVSAAAFTPDQELVAQAWKVTDNSFVDRTFSGQDWFARRQKMVKKQYTGREEAYEEIRSMLKSLNDKYTRFLTPSMYTAIYATATGDVAGIGIELQNVEDSQPPKVRVSSVVEGAPSDKAGLKDGDVLEEADGDSLLGLSPEEAAAKIRGPVGSKLRLVVRSPGAEESQVKLIPREKVKLAGVTSSVQSAGGSKVAFIRVKQFSTTTAEDVAAALKDASGAKARASQSAD